MRREEKHSRGAGLAPEPPSACPCDGRRQRSERAKQAALDALWALLHEGELLPSAQRVASRAGMSLRTLYHHYDGSEALFLELAARQTERIRAIMVPLSPELPLEERLLALVGQRATLYETITPLRRAALLHEPASPVLSTGLVAFRALKREQTEALFGSELRSLQGHGHNAASARPLRDLSSALGAAASWASWESLRAHVHLSVEDSKRVLLQTLASLLRQTPAAARLDITRLIDRL